MSILLKTSSVRVSSIQIMQVRVQNKGKHVWKSRYDGDVPVMLLDHDEPTNYEEAMMSPDSAKWLEAMKFEMGSMYENKVWTLVDLPDDRQAIENKWIFKKKTDADGNVTVYKARLVAKGFRQVQGLTMMRPSHP